MHQVFRATLHPLTVFVALALGAPAVDAAGPATTSATDGVRHDRLIVRYRDNATVRFDAQAHAQPLRDAIRRAGLDANRTMPLTARNLRRTAGGAEVVKLSRALDRVETAALLRNLQADPDVVHAEVDDVLHHTGLERRSVTLQPRRATVQSTPDDPYYAQYQWHFHNPTGGIRAPAAWDASTGDGIVVAVLHTGLTAHSGLDDNVLEGNDIITDAFISRRGTDERAPGAQDLGDWNDDATQCPVSDSSWHGTHVTGTVAEKTGNGVGMAGVAHNAKVLPVRVLGRCGGYESDIADAIVWASGGNVDGVPANTNPAEVINLSLGGAGVCDAQSEMQLAINDAISRGTTVVVAAGNDNSDAANFTPASCSGSITVGATRITGGRASYSNFGARIDLSAPGGGGSVDGNPGGHIWRGWHGTATSPVEGAETYIGYTGTSMAAPHVAGVVALLQSVAQTPLSPAQVKTLLVDTARDFPVSIPSATPLGAGILDAAAAVEQVANPCEGDDCGPPDAAPIINGVPMTGLGGAAGDEVLLALTVPAGASGLSILSYGGMGDVTLLASHGKEPTIENADFRSARPGNNETLRIPTPQAGVYYIKLVGLKTFSGVSVLAKHQ